MVLKLVLGLLAQQQNILIIMIIIIPIAMMMMMMMKTVINSFTRQCFRKSTREVTAKGKKGITKS